MKSRDNKIRFLEQELKIEKAKRLELFNTQEEHRKEQENLPNHD